MIIPITTELYRELEESWTEYIDQHPNDDFFGQYRQMLGAAENSLGPRPKNSQHEDHYYILKSVRTSKLAGLLQIFKVLENSGGEYWKILAVRSHPSLDSRNQLTLKQHLDRHDKVTKFVIDLFGGAVLLVNNPEVNAGRVKILGNTQIDSSFFAALKKTMDNPTIKKGLVDVNQDVNVSTHNRWLQIDTK